MPKLRVTDKIVAFLEAVPLKSESWYGRIYFGVVLAVLSGKCRLEWGHFIATMLLSPLLKVCELMVRKISLFRVIVYVLLAIYLGIFVDLIYHPSFIWVAFLLGYAAISVLFAAWSEDPYSSIYDFGPKGNALEILWGYTLPALLLPLFWTALFSYEVGEVLWKLISPAFQIIKVVGYNTLGLPFRGASYLTQGKWTPLQVFWVALASVISIFCCLAIYSAHLHIISAGSFQALSIEDMWLLGLLVSFWVGVGSILIYELVHNTVVFNVAVVLAVAYFGVIMPTEVWRSFPNFDSTSWIVLGVCGVTWLVVLYAIFDWIVSVYFIREKIKAEKRQGFLQKIVRATTNWDNLPFGVWWALRNK